MSRCSQTKLNFRRTCLSCRAVGNKRDLVRLVRTAEGAVELDLAGKQPGRGAYLCARGACLTGGIKRERMEKALRTRLEPANIRRLEEELKSLDLARTVGDESA